MTGNKTRTRATHRLRSIGRFFALLCVGLLGAAFADPVHAAAAGSSALPEALASNELLWELKLGTHQYTIPRIDGGQIFIGINDRNLDHPVLKRTGGGILMALDEKTGKMIWQLAIPRYMRGTQAPYHFNHWQCGVCSTPAVDGKRLYIVGPRGDVLCVDRLGQADGNDKPFVTEAEYMQVPADSDYRLIPADGDIIWRFDMIEKLGVVPHDVCGSCPLLHGDYLYVCTSNGQDDKHKFTANPEAPSLIVFDKRTGGLVAADGELIGKHMFHGHWSSPVLASPDGRDIILFGGGDGVLYAFEPIKAAPHDGDVQTLRRVWKHDCNPPDYRRRDGKPIPYSKWNNKSPEGPSEVIAIPVVHNNRIYVAIGQSPIHGPGRGMLSCLDAATGNPIWESRRVDRTLATAAIDEGLLYTCDYSGRLHCIDADTGEHCWQHELGAGVWSASPAVIDGKVYVSTEEKDFWVLKAGRQKQVLTHCRLRSVAITPTAKNGVFYLPTQHRLFALKMRSDAASGGK